MESVEWSGMGCGRMGWGRLEWSPAGILWNIWQHITKDSSKLDSGSARFFTGNSETVNAKSSIGILRSTGGGSPPLSVEKSLFL